MQGDGQNRNATAVGAYQMEVETSALVRTNLQHFPFPGLLGVGALQRRCCLPPCNYFPPLLRLMFCFLPVRKYIYIYIHMWGNVPDWRFPSLDPGRGGYPVPDAHPQGSVAVWQVADGGGQRGGDESGSRGGEGGGGVERVAGG